MAVAGRLVSKALSAEATLVWLFTCGMEEETREIRKLREGKKKAIALHHSSYAELWNGKGTSKCHSKSTECLDGCMPATFQNQSTVIT